MCSHRVIDAGVVHRLLMTAETCKAALNTLRTDGSRKIATGPEPPPSDCSRYYHGSNWGRACSIAKTVSMDVRQQALSIIGIVVSQTCQQHIATPRN